MCNDNYSDGYDDGLKDGKEQGALQELRFLLKVELKGDSSLEQYIELKRTMHKRLKELEKAKEK